jgi:hypothetical protein
MRSKTHCGEAWFHSNGAGSTNMWRSVSYIKFLTNCRANQKFPLKHLLSPSDYLPTCPSVFTFHLSVRLSTSCLSVYLPICLSVYLPVWYLSVYPSTYLSTHPCIYPSIYLFIYLSIYLSIYPCVRSPTLMSHLMLHNFCSYFIGCSGNAQDSYLAGRRFKYQLGFCLS